MTRVSKIFSGAMSALLTTASVSLSYLCLYTAYSKQSKALELGLLLDTLLVRRNLTHTLLELNKAISLAGLTVLALAFAPGFELQAAALRLHALVLLVLHSALSFNKLYGSKLFPDIKQLSKAGSDRMLALKFGSIFLAGAAQNCLWLGNLGYISLPLMAYGAVGLGTLHFYSMEIDYKNVLQVRPFAYAALVAAAVALVNVLSGATE